MHLELIVFWSTLATRNDSRTHPASVFWVWSGTNCSRPAMACLKRVRPPLVIPAQDVPQSLSGVDFINVFFFVDCSKRQFPIKILKNCLYIRTVMIKILLMKLILIRSGLDSGRAKGTIQLSIGRSTTTDEIERAAGILEGTYNNLDLIEWSTTMDIH